MFVIIAILAVVVGLGGGAAVKEEFRREQIKKEQSVPKQDKGNDFVEILK